MFRIPKKERNDKTKVTTENKMNDQREREKKEIFVKLHFTVR